MNLRYRVDLNQSERDQLTALLSGGKHPARKLERARILLAADAGVSDVEIAARVVVGGSTVYRTKRRLVEGNLELALAEELRPGAARKLTGKEEALAQGHVVHSRGRRRLCRRYGGCPRALCRALRPQAPGDLLRREPDPADRRGTPADPGRAGTA